MRKAVISYKDTLAGTLTETDEGEYVFQYEEKYVKEHRKQFLTFTMPVSNKPYIDQRLFPFLKV